MSVERTTLGRVAVLAYHSSPVLEPGSGDAGGMTVYVRKVAEAFADRGVRTDIFTRATAGSRPIVELRRGVRVITIEAGPPIQISKGELTTHVDDFAAGTRAFAAAQHARYDIVHSHYWQSGLAATTLRRMWGIPWVHSQHTLARVKNQHLAPDDPPEPRSRIDGEDAIMRTADVLIASTDDEWRQLSCLYGVTHDRLKTIHPGVDHAIFHPGDRGAARARLGLGDEAMLIYAGRIQPLKGLELAIQAVERLAHTLERRSVLYIVGGASGTTGTRELARLRDLARRLGVSDRVRFLGPTEHRGIPSLLRAADVAVVCSHTESFGLVALEAHACGTPVVGTAVGGLSHIVQDQRTGFLVQTRDPDVFAARLHDLLSDDRLRQRFARNAVLSASLFSWQDTADALLELYECLLRESWPQLCTC